MSTSQFHTDPLRSAQGPHLFSALNPSVQHEKPVSSTPKTPQFNNPSVQHILQFNTPFSSTQPSVQHQTGVTQKIPKNSKRS